MISKVGIESNVILIDKAEKDTIFEVLQYDSVNETSRKNNILDKNVKVNDSNKLRQIKIILDNTVVRIQKNSLCYIKGNIEEREEEDRYKSLKEILFSNKYNNITSNYKTILSGAGEILLKPSFEYFTLAELIDDEIIIKDEAFCACDEEIEVNRVNDDELVLKGNGIVVLKLPVPENEIIRCRIFKDRIIADKNISILRSHNITCQEDKSILINEEGLNIYSGTGEVWLLPTKIVYNNDANKSFEDLDDDE